MIGIPTADSSTIHAGPARTLSIDGGAVIIEDDTGPGVRAAADGRQRNRRGRSGRRRGTLSNESGRCNDGWTLAQSNEGQAVVKALMFR